MSRIALLILLVVAVVVVLPAAAQSDSYTVEYGDVLDIIAARFDVSVNCVAEASGLDNPNQMRPGQVLSITASCPPYDGAIPIVSTRDADQGGGTRTSGGDYTVVRGDVLDSIAMRFDVALNCLIEANNLALPHRIFIGDTLAIERSCPPYHVLPLSAVSSAETNQGGGGAGSGGDYIVVRGDVLDLIAAHFNVQVACLGAANDLAPLYRIYPGDSLTIDTSCPPYDGEALNT
jgi:LysM repeat protein